MLRRCDSDACQVDSRKTLLAESVQNIIAELPKERKPLVSDHLCHPPHHQYQYG